MENQRKRRKEGGGRESKRGGERERGREGGRERERERFMMQKKQIQTIFVILVTAG